MIDVTEVEVLSGRTVRLRLSDGSERELDPTPFLWGPMFESIANHADELHRSTPGPTAPTSTRACSTATTSRLGGTPKPQPDGLSA